MQCVCVCVYNGILLSHKKNGIMTFAATWMDIEMIILSEMSETNTYYMILLICIYVKRIKVFAATWMDKEGIMLREMSDKGR